MILKNLTSIGRYICKRKRVTEQRPLDFLPPNLPPRQPESLSLPDNHLLADIACTRYWHQERHREFAGLGPPGIPHWLRRFDWLIGWEHGWANLSTFPRSVFCHPRAIQGLVEFLEANYTQGLQSAVAVVGGEDVLLSHQDPNVIDRLGAFFNKIYYEAYDVNHPDVELMPIGLTEFYLRGVEDDVRQAIGAAREKESLVLAAFGRFWPKLNERIDDRKECKNFSERSEFVRCGPFSRAQYFNELSIHKYMLCPRGNGIQSPKILEAFLARCIPIMTDSPMARRLAAKGAPILIVDFWEQITPEYLKGVYTDYKGLADDFSIVASNLDAYWDFSFEC